jgi:hypothetical protein
MARGNGTRCCWVNGNCSRYGLRCDVTVPGLGRMSCFVGLLFAAAVIASGPGSARSLQLPACAARSLTPAVRTNGAGGTILIYAGLRNTGGHACLAGGRLVLALRDARTHRLLRIHGNPHAKTVLRRLRVSTNNIFTLQWSNYCGPGKPLLLVVSFGAQRAVERDHYPGARCESPDAPSQLRLFRLTG